MLKKFSVGGWWKVIKVSALSLSLKDKDRFRDWESLTIRIGIHYECSSIEKYFKMTPLKTETVSWTKKMNAIQKPSYFINLIKAKFDFYIFIVFVATLQCAMLGQMSRCLTWALHSWLEHCNLNALNKLLLHTI